MRQQDHPFQAEEGLRHLGLGGEDIEPRAVDRARSQGFDQRRLVDEAAAGDVDDDPVGAESSQDLGIDDPVRLRTAGRHDHQDVHGPRHLQQGRVEGIGHVVLPAAAVIGEGHAEPFEAARDGPPDPAEAEDAHMPAAQGRGERVGPRRPVPGAQVAVRLRDLAHGRQEQPEGEVGHLVGEHVRRVRDDDAPLRRGADIDRIVADAETRHDLELGQFLDEGAVDGGLRPGRHGADARSDLAIERVGIGRGVGAVEGEGARQRFHHAGLHRLQEQQVGRLHVALVIRPRNRPWKERP